MEVGDISTSILPSSEVYDSLWIPNTKPSFRGPASTVSFDDFQEQMRNEEGCLHQPEKKRRLSADQVHFLERSFEVENKLEPERKLHLAQKLGLQPRQVAIWFQNRRARYRTKQIEKEFDSLKSSYDKLSADFAAISKQNQKLRHEVQLLKEKLKSKEKGSYEFNTFEAEPQSTILADRKSLSTTVCKQEDNANSAKSDVLDSDSPHCTDANQYSSFLETANSSQVFESDFSQDEDDSLIGPNLFHTLSFPKLEDHHDLHTPANSCNLGFSISDQTPAWFWTSGLVD